MRTMASATAPVASMVEGRGGVDEAKLNDGVWVMFLMFSLDFVYKDLSRRYGNSERKRWDLRVNGRWTCVNISLHSPWRHIEGRNQPETNVQRRKIPINHSAGSVSTEVSGHWNDCFGCDVMRLAVLDLWGVVSSRQTSGDERGATSWTTDPTMEQRLLNWRK